MKVKDVPPLQCFLTKFESEDGFSSTYIKLNKYCLIQLPRMSSKNKPEGEPKIVLIGATLAELDVEPCWQVVLELLPWAIDRELDYYVE